MLEKFFLKRKRGNNLAEESASEVDANGLDLGVVVEGIFSEFSANTALFESTERCLYYVSQVSTNILGGGSVGLTWYESML